VQPPAATRFVRIEQVRFCRAAIRQPDRAAFVNQRVTSPHVDRRQRGAVDHVKLAADVAGAPLQQTADRSEIDKLISRLRSCLAERPRTGEQVVLGLAAEQRVIDKQEVLARPDRVRLGGHG